MVANNEIETQILNPLFDNKFEMNNFLNFLKEAFPKIELKNDKKIISKEFKPFIDSAFDLGVYKAGSNMNSNFLRVFVVKLKKSSSLTNARTMQRNLIAKFLKNGLITSALVAFYDDFSDNWRLSFVKVEKKLVRTKTRRLRPLIKLSPPKRFSFLVGNEKNHTCKSRFFNLIKNVEVPNLMDIEDVFSVETVTDEFFDEYKRLYLDLKDSLDEVREEEPNVDENLKVNNIESADFAKKLMGQLVFIYFLQKKGWLGLKPGDTCGSGPKDFLRKLFNKEYIDYNNFFNEILEPLFYSGFSEDVPDNHYSKFGFEVPFLNGGLFEPINGYSWEATDIVLKNDIFSEILDTFDKFNFTIKEDEPLEKEVAVDPEMLGKVFENLMEVIARKKNGAFYTPRYIVHYICKETLISYLNENSNVPKDDLIEFINNGDVALESIIRNKQEILANSRNPTKIKLPDSIIENSDQLNRLLENIRIVDPAVGSGAFPVGMMNEIVRIRQILFLLNERDINIYDFKKQTIENSLYGVDKDYSATDITKLRFWLSLIVDEDDVDDINDIQPLPNLDNNIRCGNSLISPNDLDLEELSSEEIFEINPFDWNEQFSEIFEEGGFDAVIGNPPYVNISNMPSNQKEILKSNYESGSQGRFDLYVLFIEKAINLLNDGGAHGFIVPDKLCNQKYATNIRNMMLNVNMQKIVDLRTINVFKGASVKNIVYILKKDSASQKLDIFKPTKEDIDNKILEKNGFTTKQEFYSTIPQYMFRLDYRKEYKPIIDKIDDNSIKLKEICHCQYGFQPGDLSKFTFNLNENPERKNEHPDEVIKKFIKGRNIKPYYIDFTDDYVFYLPEKLHRPAFKELFEYPKIVISEISKNIEATFDENKFYGNEKVVHVLPWKYMMLVDEKIINRRGIQFDEKNITNSEEYCLKYILPLLNSKIMQFYFKITLSDDINVYPDNVKELPILIADNVNKKTFRDYCNKMLELTEILVSCKTPNQKNIFRMQINKINDEINQLIYELYNLTDEEIAVVENEVGDNI